MIDKNNYEAFFLDYLEGNLSEAEQQALYCFLLQYPELKAELDDMQLTEVEQPDARSSKQSLKDIPFNTDFEDFCIAKLENDLTYEEAGLFDEFLLADNARTKAYLQYEKTKLTADKTVVYPYKSELKKQRIVLFPYWKTAVAASVILLMAVGIRLFNSPQTVNRLAIISSLPKTALSPIENKAVSNSLAKRYYPYFTTKNQLAEVKNNSSEEKIKRQVELIDPAALQEIQSELKPLANAPVYADIIKERKEPLQQTPANSGLANIGLAWKSSIKREPQSLLYAAAKAGVNKISSIVKSKIKTRQIYDNQIEVSKLDAENQMYVYSSEKR